MNPKKYLSLLEASKDSPRSYWSLREAFLNGELKGTRFSPRGKIYIKREDLDQYFEAHSTGPLAEAR